MVSRNSKIVHGTVAAIASMCFAVGHAQAMSCADFGTQVVTGWLITPNDASEFPFDIDLVAGDQVSASVSWVDNGGTVGVGLRDSMETFKPAVDYAGSLGHHQTAPYTVASDRPGDQLIVYISNRNSPDLLDFSLSVTCVPAAAAPIVGQVETIQEGVLRQSSLRATAMISSLVNDSIEASFAARTDLASSLMGYAGHVLVSSTPDLTGGPSAWAGLRYDWLLNAQSEWSGAQVTGAAGLHLVDESWRFGIFGAYESSGFELATSGSTAGGRGFSFGVTGAYQADDWRLQLVGYGSRLGYDVNDAGISASFGASRLAVEGKLVGTVPISAQIDFEPEAGMMLVHERQDAYDDSTGVAHAARSVLTLRGTAGGTVTVHPLEGDLTLSTGAFADYWMAEGAGAEGLTGRVEASGRAIVSDMLSLQLTTGLNGIGKQLSASIRAGAQARF